MKRTLAKARKAGRLFAVSLGSLACLGVPGVAMPGSYPGIKPAPTTIEAIRSDWLRIGHDMRRVMDRENARIEKAKKSAR